MTSEWSPNIDNACVAIVLAATCITVGSNSPAILYILGIINNSPWDAVNVVVNAPACKAPCTAPAAPPSLCISTILGMFSQIFFCPLELYTSTCSPIGEAGVIG